MTRPIYDLSKKELEQWLVGQGLKKYALTQILQWLYQKKATSFEEMTNISKETRTLLARDFTIPPLEVVGRRHSAVDGSTKYLFRLADGNAVESVLMQSFSRGSRRPLHGQSPMEPPPQRLALREPGQKPDRITLCISSQVGCAMGCKFCKTAEMKLVRNLTQGEILGQILGVQKELPAGARISNIVMMGMGEPFHNYETVVNAIGLMIDDMALGISQRKITVSTVGLAPEIERFAKDAKVKLALSLNATTEVGRLDLMPITRRYPLERVIEACRNYAFASKHKVTFEYVMMAGVNDSLEDAKRIQTSSIVLRRATRRAISRCPS